MKATIKTFKDVNGCWRWHIVARNGEVLASSEAYSSKRAMLDTAKMLADATGMKISK